MGVNPSLIINKGIYIQHVDGGLYTKENWSNKGYSNDLCNGVNFSDPIVLNYDSHQYKMPDLVIDGPHDRIVRADPNSTWAIECTDADFTPLPYPESWSGQGLNSMFLSEMKRLAPGDHHVSYTAYINLDLIDDGGSKVHTKYLILKKTLNFTI